LRAARRPFLTLIALAISALALAPWRRAAAGLGSDSSDSRFGASFAMLFSDPQGAREIGRRYLALFPEAADLQDFKNSLLPEDEGNSPDRIRARLAELRRSDFAAGRTIVLDGWILARSEVQACALLAVLPRG
jgi:hypothetical protein